MLYPKEKVPVKTINESKVSFANVLEDEIKNYIEKNNSIKKKFLYPLISVAILFNKNKIIPISSRLSNWNGVDDVCLGAPVVIGNIGVVKLWQIELTIEEKEKISNYACTGGYGFPSWKNLYNGIKDFFSHDNNNLFIT